MIIAEFILGLLVCLPFTHPPLKTYLLFFIFPTIASIVIDRLLDSRSWQTACRYCWLAFYISLLAGYHVLETLTISAVNFIPFNTLHFYYEALLNGMIPLDVVLVSLSISMAQYLPLTIFLWFFGRWSGSWKANLLLTISCAATIEAIQWILNRGICDIDDVILTAISSTILLLILYHMSQNFQKRN